MPEFIRKTLYGALSVILLLAGSATTTAAAPCDPEQSSWVPGKYYQAGSVVFHEGSWFESRSLQEGKEPGTAFDWKRLVSVPDCGARGENGKVATEANTAEAGSSGQPPTQNPEEAEALCEPPEPWLFSRSYTVGSLTRHGGKVWEAIRPTNGDMPGIAEPPHWKPVKDHCANENQ